MFWRTLYIARRALMPAGVKHITSRSSHSLWNVRTDRTRDDTCPGTSRTRPATALYQDPACRLAQALARLETTVRLSHFTSSISHN